MNLNQLWVDILEGTGVAEARPDFRFDPVFYAARYPDLVESGVDLQEHFQTHGQSEGRLGSLYREIRSKVPDLEQRLNDFVADPRLRAAMQSGQEGAFELFFELVMLGDPIDRMISDFSAEHYFRLYPDVQEAGVAAFPHYLQFGRDEGRRSLQSIRRNQFAGQQTYDKNRPTCIICLHEFSRSGAPIVGLDIARQACETHNVVIMALRPGPLLESFRETAFTMVVTERPGEDLDYLHLPDPAKFDFAILNSVESWVFARYLVRRSIPFATYIHEFTDYIPVGRSIWGALFSDLMVFVSDVVRKSWEPIFSDMNFDVARDSLVVAQRELHKGFVSKNELTAARDRISRLIGTDCKDRRIIYGGRQRGVAQGGGHVRPHSADGPKA